MLLAGALTLAVPVIGWQSVNQLDESLRQDRAEAQELRVANTRLALADTDTLANLLRIGENPRQAADIYAERSRYPLFVDGYADDWQNLTSRPRQYVGAAGTAVAIWAATRQNRLHLHLLVADERVVYHQPLSIPAVFGERDRPNLDALLVNGDAIELIVGTPDDAQRDTEEPVGNNSRVASQHWLLRAEAPGPIPVRDARTGQPTFVANAVWQAATGGYQVELDLPLPPRGAYFGIAVIDIDELGAPRDNWVGNFSPESMRLLSGATEVSNENSTQDNAPSRLYHVSNEISNTLGRWITPGVRARLFDKQGRLLAEVNELYADLEDDLADDTLDPAKGSLFNALLFRLFSYFVASQGDDALDGDEYPLRDGLHLDTQRLVDNDKYDIANGITASSPLTRRYVNFENDRVLGTLVPMKTELAEGYLLVESNEDLATAYAGSRLARLFSLLTLVSLMAGGVLFVYATTLSIRIRKLSRQAEQAVTDDGRIMGFTGSDAHDEIGDLSRHLSSLLHKSAGYTQYLEALSSRLSHELRTPLSVVKTSIEHLDRDQLDDESRQLLDRASGGADQLGGIIRALVESTRLEQTVQLAQQDAIDLDEWMGGYSTNWLKMRWALHKRIPFASLANYKQVLSSPPCCWLSLIWGLKFRQKRVAKCLIRCFLSEARHSPVKIRQHRGLVQWQRIATCMLELQAKIKRLH